MNKAKIIRFRGDPAGGSVLRLVTNDCERGRFGQGVQVRRAAHRIIEEMRAGFLAGCEDMRFYPSDSLPWRSEDPNVDDGNFRRKVLSYASDEIVTSRDYYLDADIARPDFKAVHRSDELSLALVSKELGRLKQMKPPTSVDSVKAAFAKLLKAVGLYC